MNAAIRTVRAHRRQPRARGDRRRGRGYEGLLAGDVMYFPVGSTDGITAYGGTILGSARCAPFMKPEGREEACRQLQELGIDALVVIGGNGSLTGAHLLAEAGVCRVVGLPASDRQRHRPLRPVDRRRHRGQHLSSRPADSHLRHGAGAPARLHRRVMGRHCGFLAMRAWHPPPRPTSSCTASGSRPRTRWSSGCVASCARAFGPTVTSSACSSSRPRGRHPDGAAARAAAGAPSPRTAPAFDVRETILGHVVRGGHPTALDRSIAQRLGYAAVVAAEAGASDVMISWEPYGDPGTPTMDTSVRVVPLATVLAETARLLDGTSPLVQFAAEDAGASRGPAQPLTWRPTPSATCRAA
jgi:6-phosphofructokinase 1